jgi:hypothetical protein
MILTFAVKPVALRLVPLSKRIEWYAIRNGG